MRTQSMQQDILDRATRLTVKIGTNSLIDTDNWVVRREWLKRIISSLADLKREFGIVSSGAIGMARVEMDGRKPISIEERQAFAAIGQPILFQTYQAELLRAKLRGAQVLLTKHDLTSEPGFSTSQGTLRALRQLDTIYIANENDTVANDEIKVGDNDNLGALTAIADEATTLILITDVNGLYTANPKTNPDAQHIPVVEHLTNGIMAMGGDTNGTGGTGGMRTKLEAAFIAASKDIDTIILNGTESNCITRLFGGDFTHATFIPASSYQFN